MASTKEDAVIETVPSSLNATKSSIENIPPSQKDGNNSKKKKNKGKTQNQTGTISTSNKVTISSSSDSNDPSSSNDGDSTIGCQLVDEQANKTSSSSSKPTTQREQSLRNALTKAQEENKLLASDLTAALARVNDAENAEATVNKGLLTARSVILQREKTIAELTSNLSQHRADYATLQEEKTRLDKRLVVLNNISEKLHEARNSVEARDKRIEDYAGKVNNLKKEIEQRNSELTQLKSTVQELNKELKEVKEEKERLIKISQELGEIKCRLESTEHKLGSVSAEKQVLEKQNEVMAMIKQQLAHSERELEQLTHDKGALEIKGRRERVQVATISVVGTFAITTAFRMLRRNR